MWLIGQRELRNLIETGDLLFFDNSGDRDVEELVTRVASNAIETLTNSNWSHVAMVVSSIHVLESTIRNGVSGPQMNLLMQRVQECAGPSVWLFRMKAEERDKIDWKAALEFAHARIGRDAYSIGTLFHFLLRPVLPFVRHFWKSHSGESVCSEYVAEIYQAGGMPGLKPNQTSPETLARLPWWEQPIQIWGRESAGKFSCPECGGAGVRWDGHSTATCLRCRGVGKESA